ncbi:MAG: hypothetical protein LC799_01655 [Actinobacteria bacterium]|nr:hypothetical protein [Actinomycetota bacterium]
MLWPNLRWLATAAVLALVLAACGTDDGATVREPQSGAGGSTASGTGNGAGSGSGSGAAPTCEPVGDPATADRRVTALLDEFTVQPETSSVPAGRIAFMTHNVGAEPHELVIVRAENAAALPVKQDGSMAEDQLRPGQLVGEIEEFPAGQDCAGVFELQPGSYVLLCNIVETENGMTESHFQEGMFTEFAVT